MLKAGKLTPLSPLDAAQRQDVLLVGEELPHLVEGLLPPNGELVPRLWPGQDLADGTLGQSQHVVAKDALADVVFDQLLFNLTGDLCCVHVLPVQKTPGGGVGVAGRRGRGAASCAAPVNGRHVGAGWGRLGAAGS